MKRRDLFRGAGGALLWSAAAQEPEPVFERRGSRLRMDLDGAWRLSMDDKDVGIAKRWFAKSPQLSKHGGSTWSGQGRLLHLAPAG